MKLVLCVLGLSFALSSFAADEKWECEERVKNKSGTIDISACRNQSGQISCYEEIEETCREKNSGSKRTTERKRKTGKCVSSYADCW